MTNPEPKIMEVFYKDWTDEAHPEDPIAVANVLQYLIDEYSEVRGTGRVDKKSQVVSVKTLMKLIEEQKVKLKERLTEWYYTHDAVQSNDVIANEIVNVVKEWLKNYHKEDNNKYDFDYFSGWADCIDILERDLR